MILVKSLILSKNCSNNLLYIPLRWMIHDNNLCGLSFPSFFFFSLFSFFCLLQLSNCTPFYPSLITDTFIQFIDWLTGFMRNISKSAGLIVGTTVSPTLFGFLFRITLGQLYPSWRQRCVRLGARESSQLSWLLGYPHVNRYNIQ